MKVIVVSVAAWDRNNNFGKTFCDIFEGMEDIEFLNIYCDNGKPNNSVNAKYFQITLNDIAKNLVNRKRKVGKIVDPDSAATLSDKQKSAVKRIKSHHLRIFSWARRFLWWIGRWRTKELEQVIKDFDADFLFLPIFKNTYMNALQQYVLKVSGKKAVAY